MPLTTDKEIVDRETLLKQVWNYNPSVTTHTLETAFIVEAKIRNRSINSAFDSF